MVSAVDFDFFMRIFLAVFFTGVAMFYTLRLVFFKRQKKLLFVGSVLSAHWVGHVAFRVFRITIWLACVVRVFYPEIDRFLGVCSYLNIAPINIVGVLFLLAGFAIAVIGHGELGDQWRSGVDPNGPAVLVTDKLYSKTRNPMFIGVILAQLGFFLALPSVFSAVCLVAGVLAITNQVKLEEKHLRNVFENLYIEYCRHVPRWL